MAADLSYSAQALSVQTSRELECKVEAVVLREAWGTVWELTLAGPPVLTGVQPGVVPLCSIILQL